MPPWPPCEIATTTANCAGWPAGPPYEANHAVSSFGGTSAVPVLPAIVYWSKGKPAKAVAPVPFGSVTTPTSACWMYCSTSGDTDSFVEGALMAWTSVPSGPAAPFREPRRVQGAAVAERGVDVGHLQR